MRSVGVGFPVKLTVGDMPGGPPRRQANTLLFSEASIRYAVTVSHFWSTTTGVQSKKIV